MGLYTEYLDSSLTFKQLTDERKKQLRRISNKRNRPIIVYASDLNKKSPNSIILPDLTSIKDQLSSIEGTEIDLILETPGGFAEVVEDIVNLIRGRFEKVGIIVPGVAKSAGTILTMAGDEILMGETSALGPIDAQVMLDGSKRFSADAFLDGLNEIKKEVAKTQKLNPSYIPILQNISPGEIKHCENAQNFSKKLVTEWLTDYKFKYWEKHSSTGKTVTQDEKKLKANSIATKLCKQSNWLTHGRSIRMSDLEELGLKILNFDNDPELSDSINRYYTLLQLTFSKTAIYKIFETINTQIFNSVNPILGNPINIKPGQKPDISNAITPVKCNSCGHMQEIQLNLAPNQRLKPGAIMYPKNNLYICPKCKSQHDLTGLKLQVEAETRKKVIL